MPYNTVNRFLIIQTAFLGDVILATPIAEALHKLYPHAEVHMLVRKGHEGLLDHHPCVQEVLTWDKSNKKYQELRNLIHDVRKREYDEVINVQRFGATGLLTVLSGAKLTTGFKKNPFSWLFGRRLPHVLGQKTNSPHEVDRNLSLVKNWDPKYQLRPKIYPSDDDQAAIAHYREQPYIVLAPASVWFTKQYPVAAWLNFLAKSKLRSYNIYLVGGPEDRELCNHLTQQTSHPAVFNLAGSLSFLQTAALMERSVMTYCNDSAPLHMASAVNAPVTAIFCSTIPEFGFGPLSDNSTIAETPASLNCRPCTTHGRTFCPRGHFRCAYDISPKQLLATLPDSDLE